MNKPKNTHICGIDDFTLPEVPPRKGSQTQASVVRRPGGCHALRAAHIPSPIGSSAEDWLKALR
jgi:hypothetical protein